MRKELQKEQTNDKVITCILSIATGDNFGVCLFRSILKCYFSFIAFLGSFALFAFKHTWLVELRQLAGDIFSYRWMLILWRSQNMEITQCTKCSNVRKFSIEKHLVINTMEDMGKGNGCNRSRKKELLPTWCSRSMSISHLIHSLSV